MLNTADTRSARSTAARRFLLRSLGAGTVLITLGLAAAPASSAADSGRPLPPIRMYCSACTIL